MTRNRSDGWKHAKLSGHQNEELVKSLFADEGVFQSNFLKRLGKEFCKIVNVDVGGLNEKNVESILGGTTKSKTDLKVFLDDGTIFNISIKKSLSGQVYLIPIKHFIDGFEKQYSKTIPQNVRRAIELYWGSASDTKNIVNKFGTYKDYENHKHRAVAETIKNFDTNLYNSLLSWFKDNTNELFNFCFSKGLAKNEEDWANVIWYINKLGENPVDEMFLVEELGTYFGTNANSETSYGTVNGGSTIQLSFGFVQWHSPTKAIPGLIQFHHNFKKIQNLKKSKK